MEGECAPPLEVNAGRLRQPWIAQQTGALAESALNKMPQ
jgi:hypothetical protein